MAAPPGPGIRDRSVTLPSWCSAIGQLLRWPGTSRAVSSHGSGPVTTVRQGTRSSAPAPTSGGPSTQWCPQVKCAVSPDRLVTRSSSTSRRSPCGRRIVRSSRNGVSRHSTVNRTAVSSE